MKPRFVVELCVLNFFKLEINSNKKKMGWDVIMLTVYLSNTWDKNEEGWPIMDL